MLQIVSRKSAFTVLDSWTIGLNLFFWYQYVNITVHFIIGAKGVVNVDGETIKTKGDTISSKGGMSRMVLLFFF